MKYIKKLSSLIIESIKSDLKEFCELNLAYLMDDDYKVMITRRDSLPIESSHHKKGLIIHFYKWESDEENFLIFNPTFLIIPSQKHMYILYFKIL